MNALQETAPDLRERPTLLDLARRFGPPALAAALVAVAAYALHGTLTHFHYRDLKAEIGALSWAKLAGAIAFTAVSFTALVGYEAFGMTFAGRRLPLPMIALVAFISQSIAHSTGFAAFVGAGLRYRLYAKHGLDFTDVAKIQGFFSATFSLGMGTLLGIVLTLEPSLLANATHAPRALWLGLGLLTLGGIAGAVLWRAMTGRSARLFGHEVELPSTPVLLLQIVLALIDLGAAAAALWVLLPDALDVSLYGLIGMYVAAVLLGIVSHVPGALGVFEGTMLVFLSPPATETVATVGALLAYRAVYYILPLLLGGLLLGLLELTRAGRRLLGRLGDIGGSLVPPTTSFLALLAGAVLLFSGATPALAPRLSALGDLLPLPVIEIGHFAGSLIGAALLLLANALRRRLSGAWTLVSILLPLGALASLAKGFDWEEALFLCLVLVVLLPSRAEFYRRSRLLDEPFSPGWLLAIAAVVGVSIWLLFFAYKHVDYQHALWWQFELEADAPRSLRAALAAILLIVTVVIVRVVQPAAAAPAPPTPEDLALAQAIIEAAGSSSAHLALTGDKALLFNAERTAFIMFAVSSGSWVAMGEPVGPQAAWPSLIWSFHDLAERHGGRTVFYEIGQDHLPLFLDLGLRLVKLGEAARVPLPEFSLKGKRKGDLRNVQNRVPRAGGSFEVLGREQVAAEIGALQTVSDAWLAERETREKRFSLGFFSPAYVMSTPVTVVRHEGRIVAFANLWLAADKEDCSIDLMRFLPTAPSGSMDYLMVQTILWAQGEGYRWFDLGMAPLSGLPSHRLAPIWSKLGRLLVRHGDHFYNFAGLRSFKEKFEPVWTPAYLAYPERGLARVLADVAALVSGGWAGIIRK